MGLIDAAAAVASYQTVRVAVSVFRGFFRGRKQAKELEQQVSLLLLACLLATRVQLVAGKCEKY